MSTVTPAPLALPGVHRPARTARATEPKVPVGLAANSFSPSPTAVSGSSTTASSAPAPKSYADTVRTTMSSPPSPAVSTHRPLPPVKKRPPKPITPSADPWYIPPKMVFSITSCLGLAADDYHDWKAELKRADALGEICSARPQAVSRTPEIDQLFAAMPVGEARHTNQLWLVRTACGDAVMSTPDNVWYYRDIHTGTITRLDYAAKLPQFPPPFQLVSHLAACKALLFSVTSQPSDSASPTPAPLTSEDRTLKGDIRPKVTEGGPGASVRQPRLSRRRMKAIATSQPHPTSAPLPNVAAPQLSRRQRKPTEPSKPPPASLLTPPMRPASSRDLSPRWCALVDLLPRSRTNSQT